MIAAKLLSRLTPIQSRMSSVRPSSNLAEFKQLFNKAQHIVALTGAGISAESGVPTFRGAGGFWRQYESTRLATPGAFASDPSLVWEFYHYRRELVNTKEPNAAHFALAKAEEQLKSEGRQLVVVTQNIDGLHKRAGSKNVVELHGNLYNVRCTECGVVSENHSSPICPALAGKGAPDTNTPNARIPVEKLPRCQHCAGLLRPHIVWFGENLEPLVLDRAQMYLDECDLCLVIGTSSVVYPAAMFAPELAARGIPIGEFNVEETPATDRFKFFFKGPAGETVPKIVLND